MPTAEPLFVSEKDVATMLGSDIKWLRANIKALEETTGFPKMDPVVGKRHKEAIIEWARERAFRSSKRQARMLEADQRNQENKDAF